MSDASEVKAAAELFCERGDRGLYWPVCPDGCDECDAARTLAAAYLRLTDETPVDEAWVKSLGWEGPLDANFPLWSSRPSQRGGPTVQLWWQPMFGCDAWSFEGDLIPPLKTRGQVRMLCLALGIELKEASK